MNLVLKRAELFTDLSCNSGTAKGVLPLTSCITTERVEGLVVIPRLECSVPMDWSLRAEIVNGRIIRLTWTDDTYDEYRIIAQSDADQGDGLVHIEAAGIILDLANRNFLISLTTTGVTTFAFSRYDTLPSSILGTDCCGAGPSYFSAPLGLITPTALIDTAFSADTPLSGAVKVATEANRITGATYWLSAIRNGSTGYYLILMVGSYTPGVVAPKFVIAKNIVSLKRRQDSTQQTTRAVVGGTDGSHCGQNYWIVGNVVLNTSLDLTDINGGTGPVQETDQFTNLYLEKAGGGTQQVTGTTVVSAATSRIALAATAGFVNGDRIRIVKDATPTDLTYVDCVANKATYGVKVGKLEVPHTDVYNRLLNADLRSGSPPTSWTKTGGGTIVTDSTPGNYLYGGRSFKLTATTITLDQTVTAQIPAAGNWYVTYCCAFKIDPSGAPGTAQFGAFYAGALIPGAPIDLNAYADGQWHLVYQSYLAVAGSRTLQMSCVMGRVMWFNGGMIYLTQGSAVQQPFFLGSGGARMIQQANAHLLTNSAPLVSYGMEMVDLYRVDPVTWAGDLFGLGNLVYVYDGKLGLPSDGSVNNALQVVEIVTNHLVPADTRITVANRQELFWNQLALGR